MESTITHHTATLSLPDPSLPPLTLTLTSLKDSIIVFVGTGPGPYSIANDFACGMTVRPLIPFSLRRSIDRISIDPSLEVNLLLRPSLPRRVTPVPSQLNYVSFSTLSRVSYIVLRKIGNLIAKRYNLQIFLSLDLTAVAGKGTSEDFMLLQMEKAVVVELDRYLKR